MDAGRRVVKTTYGVHDDQIVGGASWVNEERYGVVAKAATDRPTSVFRDEARVMLRAALADRFGLEMHRERREIPVYVLLIAARDGLTGLFDWDLQWTPDALTSDATSSTTTLPLVTALREQLGLRLEPRREAAEVMVIDRAERPAPDWHQL